MEYEIPTFEFGGHQIDVVIKEVPQTTEFQLKNHIARGIPGSAQSFVLEDAIKSPMKVNGKDKVLNRKQADGTEEFIIPNIRDKETRQGLGDKLLHLIVEHNDFLGYVEPLKDVFAQYLPEDEQDAENPTEETDSSGNTSD